MTTSRVLVWDLPTRIFHWLLTFGLVACFAFAELSGEHGPWFSVHMMIGIVLGLMLVMRVGWGIVGSRYARFGAFLYSPSTVWSYVRGAFTGKEHRHIGHNPGSAYAIFAMLILLAMAVVTGLMMSGGGEDVEELHEFSSYALVAVVVAHIAGVVWYSVRQRENITRMPVPTTLINAAVSQIQHAVVASYCRCSSRSSRALICRKKSMMIACVY